MSSPPGVLHILCIDNCAFCGSGFFGAITAAVLLSPLVAAAQPSVDPFDRAVLALRAGQRVVITDVGGGNTKGTVVTATPSSITLTVREGIVDERRSFDRALVSAIRRTDSLWNGIFIGAAAGFVATEVWARQSCGNDSECAAITRLAGWGALVGGGAAAGALVDRFTGNDVIYRAGGVPTTLRIAPLLGPHTTGMAVSLRF